MDENRKLPVPIGANRLLPVIWKAFGVPAPYESTSRNRPTMQELAAASNWDEMLNRSHESRESYITEIKSPSSLSKALSWLCEKFLHYCVAFCFTWSVVLWASEKGWIPHLSKDQLAQLGMQLGLVMWMLAGLGRLLYDNKTGLRSGYIGFYRAFDITAEVSRRSFNIAFALLELAFAGLIAWAAHYLKMNFPGNSELVSGIAITGYVLAALIALFACTLIFESLRFNLQKAPDGNLARAKMATADELENSGVLED